MFRRKAINGGSKEAESALYLMTQVWVNSPRLDNDVSTDYHFTPNLAKAVPLHLVLRGSGTQTKRIQVKEKRCFLHQISLFDGFLLRQNDSHRYISSPLIITRALGVLF